MWWKKHAETRELPKCPAPNVVFDYARRTFEGMTDADRAFMNSATDVELLQDALMGMTQVAHQMSEVHMTASQRCRVCTDGKKCAHCLAEDLKVQEAVKAAIAVEVIRLVFNARKQH